MENGRTTTEKKSQFLVELKNCMGVKTIAARRCKIGRTMLYQYIKEDTDFALKVKAIEDSVIDFVESKLHELILLGDRASIMFYLKAKAKDRGYY